MLQWIIRLYSRMLLSIYSRLLPERAYIQATDQSSEETCSTYDSFRFSPELFEVRNEVIECLTDRGFEWLTHYSSVDVAHDVHGIEVCGIRDETDAIEIQEILIKMFPEWYPGCLCYKGYGREPGFKARVCRDRDRPSESIA